MRTRYMGPSVVRIIIYMLMSTCPVHTEILKMCRFLSVSLALLACLGSLTYAQPQCTDLQPPFENYGAYCTAYSGYGCCGKREERLAQKKATFALNKLATEQEKEICSDIFRNVSCLSCSPFSRHIYHNENGTGQFPLCRGYCVETYVKCRASLLRMLKLRPWRDGLVSKHPRSREELEKDAEAFCQRYAPDPADSPYCYPQVAAIERENTAPPEEASECVCAIPVASGLRQALAVVGAGDGSDRLFIMEQPGLVRVLDKDRNVIEEPFLDMTAQLMASGDIDGILNIAFHPRYKQNGLVYVYTHQVLEKNISVSGFDKLTVNISEFRVQQDNPNQVNYESQRLVFSMPYLKRHPVHELVGGAFFFEGGYLFLGIGEDEEVEGVQLRGQDL